MYFVKTFIYFVSTTIYDRDNNISLIKMFGYGDQNEHDQMETIGEETMATKWAEFPTIKGHS